MKLPLYTLEKKRTGDISVPSQLEEPYRPDLIRRAVHAYQSSQRQPYGTFPEAGQRWASKVSKRRRDYRGCYGFGISRVNRKILSRRGTRMFWVGATTPQTTGGRRAHPPKASKYLEEHINVRERRKALRSAMSATLSKDLVQQRGHKVPLEYPFVIDTSVELLQKTSEVRKLLEQLGFSGELERTAEVKVRAGKGKSRGRKYRRKKGILLVVGENCPLVKSAGNIPGVEAVPVKSLHAELLAPGAMPGRIALWTSHAVDVLAKEKLYT